MKRGWVKYGVLALLCAWMFFSGILVGRGTSPVAFDTAWFQKRLAVIFDGTGSEEQVIAKPTLEFYTALQSTDRLGELDFISVSKGKTALEEANPQNGTQDGDGMSQDAIPLKKSRKTMTLALRKKQPSFESHTDTASSTAVVASVKEKKVGYGNRKLPSVSSRKAVSSSGSSNSSGAVLAGSSMQASASSDATPYTIQIASYLNESDAKRHMAQLKAKGYRVYQNAATVNKKQWFRLRSGSYKNISDANTSLKRFQKEGIKALVIRKK